MEDSDRPTELTVVEAAPLDLRPLTSEEDLFCVALLESGGNPLKAYKMIDPECSQPGVKGRALLVLPHVQARLRQLTESVKENSLISLGTHLIELANLRDLAVAQGNLKVALQAERNRGEVAGFYDKAALNVSGPSNIQINFVSKHDERI